MELLPLVVEKLAVRLLQRNKFIQAKLLKSNQGFTVIEILIALVLITLVMAMALSNPFSTSQDLDQESDNIERAIRFMSDEAVLRNSVVRLHFMLGKAPQEYAVEYGPSSSFVLPPEPEHESTSQSKEEEEKEAKRLKETNMQFNKVQEFQDSNKEMPEGVKILGVGNGNSEKFKSTGDVSVYTFPTGEKDDAIIILANDENVISLEVNPFNQKIEKKTHKLENPGNREINDLQAAKAKEIFETWLKER
ncbi:type II secretion system protein [Bacteriovorax stolpii]|uniref:Uncharacterized protein n=1 Tax=Bacteriovorax stolpii TaxID=960 RepID=A0A2K9NT91_BACTC|nr:type II secretion system protein [Bacteriovorax stolpii]AUN97964.1 hypothetical protein C0V70_07555 [Bacteriovorax stolpii]QDK42050.1 type II secretion system protein [Bacteriovorax stolpii]TDP51797.1 prepilin-type N-terminal cleavage/methylation domain-containing protein [Bacteriovorax stolpii]